MASLSNFDQRQTINSPQKVNDPRNFPRLRARNCAFAPFRVVYVPQVALKDARLNLDCLRVGEIISAVSSVWNVPERDIIGPRQSRRFTVPRQVVMYLARLHCSHLSFPQIARELGGRDHTTIMYGARKIESDLQRDKTLAASVRVAKVLLGIEP